MTVTGGTRQQPASGGAGVVVFDIGNGSIKWGRFAQGNWGCFERGELTESGRLPLDTDPTVMSPDIAVSVNPLVLRRWTTAHPSLRVVGHEIPIPLSTGYETCGDDRVCALAGALREADAALVLDAGTCLVATAGTLEHGVIGGAIAPGPDLMARALSEGTASLPHVEFCADASALGRSTPAAIQAGLDAAHVGAARELIARIRREMTAICPDFGLFVVSTGTGGEALAERIPEIDAFRPYLPLWGALWGARPRDLPGELPGSDFAQSGPSSL